MCVYEKAMENLPSRLTRYSAANQMAQMAQMQQPAGMFGPQDDPDKVFQSEAENLEVLEHHCVLDGIEERLLSRYNFS